MVAMRNVKYLAILLFSSAVLAGCGGSNTTTSDDPVPALLKDPAAVQRGKDLFLGTCSAYCHKTTNVASEAPFLFDCDWLHGGSSKEIFHTITNGVKGTRMVSFHDAFSDQDRWAIVAYLKSASQCPAGPANN